MGHHRSHTDWENTVPTPELASRLAYTYHDHDSMQLSRVAAVADLSEHEKRTMVLSDMGFACVNLQEQLDQRDRNVWCRPGEIWRGGKPAKAVEGEEY